VTALSEREDVEQRLRARRAADGVAPDDGFTGDDRRAQLIRELAGFVMSPGYRARCALAALRRKVERVTVTNIVTEPGERSPEETARAMKEISFESLRREFGE